MRNKSTQFPGDFVVRKVETDIFSRVEPLPQVDSPNPNFWKTNRSNEIRIASRLAQSRADASVFKYGHESIKDRYVRNKIQEIQRKITSVRSQYSSSAWSQKCSSRNSKIPSFTGRSSSIRSRTHSQSQRGTSDMTDLDASESSALVFIPEPMKPILYEPVLDNPYRRRFYNEYEKAYRTAVSNFFNL